MAFLKKAFGVIKDYYNTAPIVHEELPSHDHHSINGSRMRRYLIEKGTIKPDIPSRISIIDHAFNRYVEPDLGAVVLCDLSLIPGFGAEHTGIYIGNGEIIHRNGGGYLEKTSPKQFLDRLDGKNCALSIYISCNGSNSLKNYDAYNRAIQSLQDPDMVGYDILNKNCHHFTRYCFTGDKDQWGMDFTFTSLQDMLQNKYGLTEWRIWNFQ